MTLQASGAISLTDIAEEFPDTAPHSLSEFYGASVELPSSGVISFSDFYGTSYVDWKIEYASLYVESDDLAEDDPAIDYIRAITFKPDGSALFLHSSLGYLFRFPLSTAWSVQSISSYDKYTFWEGIRDLSFSSDGTKLYTIDNYPDQFIKEYTLSTAWDHTTATLTHTIDLSSIMDFGPFAFHLKPDGTRIYMVGVGSSGDVVEYRMNTAWDLSTAAYVDTYTDALQNETYDGLFIGDEGTKLYAMGYRFIDQYSLSTAWDMSTITYDNSRLAVISEQYGNLWFKPDGLHFYVPSYNKTIADYRITPP